MGEHYSPEEIEEGLSGRLPAEKSKEMVRHLLRGCPECQAATRKERRSLTSRQGTLPPDLNAAYDATLERAEDFARRSVYLPPGERKRFRKALNLLKSGNGVLALAQTGNMELKGLGVYEALLARSWAVRYDDPKGMCHLAKVAVEVAHGLDSETYGAWRVADYAARAWGELANAYRVANRYRESEQAFGRAYEFFRQGSSNRQLLMRLLDLEASLLGTLREFDLALDRLTSLSNLYRADGETHLAGRTLITRALYTYYQGDHKEAYKSLQEGLVLIDEDRDPSLTAVAAHNHLLILVDCGNFPEAKKLLFKSRAKPTNQGRIARLKLRGIEGEIHYGLGRFESAELVFREVREGFREAGLSFACALEGLFLATALMRQGHDAEALAEGLASATMFLSLSIHRELLGSVLLLQDALENQQASLTLLENTARYLRRKNLLLGH
jgi:tetratricopeptide (TPR) repeat protein